MSDYYDSLTTKRILNLNCIQQRTEEWYRIRNNILTASDCASVLGINPYKSRKQLLREKKGDIKPFIGNFITEHGVKYEPIAIQKYESLYNDKVHETGLYIHKDFDWLGASPDGVTSSGSLVEVKCPFKRIIEHCVPDYYYPQIQVQLDVLDVDNCIFIQYKPSTTDHPEILDVLNVPRDQNWMNEHIGYFYEFFQDFHLNNSN